MTEPNDIKHISSTQWVVVPYYLVFNLVEPLVRPFSVIFSSYKYGLLSKLDMQYLECAIQMASNNSFVDLAKHLVCAVTEKQ